MNPESSPVYRTRKSPPRSSLARNLFGAGLVVAAALLSGCDDTRTPVAPPPEVSRSIADGSAAEVVTSNPQEFADALRRIGNENEVIVLLKDPNVPPMAADFLREMDEGDDLVVGVRDVPENAPRRRALGLARAGAAAQAALLRVLGNHGVEPYRYDPQALALRIPDEKLVPVLAVLLNHPSVDYVEANQKRPITFNALPLGGQAHDNKHTFHNILGAWDYTRGAGVKVGILDSGFAFNRSTGQWHPDGQLINSTTGILKNGFVDDYWEDVPEYSTCRDISGQPYGDCVPWDDNGHGTEMVGLVGANDNSFGAVGVMPQGLTISMKMVQNCVISRGCTDNTDLDTIEDDDFYWAVRWASYNGVKVLSMSFSANHDWNSSVRSALYDAYNTYNVLLLSATSNTNTSTIYPQAFSYVMGVGGLTSSGTNVGLDAYQEVSALAGGKTTLASCPSAYQFCTPSTYYGSSGGTSAATAIAAGIAGLVRAYNPGLTAPQVRQRLIATASGSHKKLDARAAVLNLVPLSVSINGTTYAIANTTETWTSSVSGGTPPYTYRWYRNGTQVSTGSSYTANVGTSDFYLQLNVTDAAGTTRSAALNVTVCSGPNCQF